MFEVSNPLAVNSVPDGRGKNDNFVGASVRIAAGASARGKVFLPSRSGEPRFGPQSYYYPASKTGVMPSRSVQTAGTPACEDERPTWATGVAA